MLLLPRRLDHLRAPLVIIFYLTVVVFGSLWATKQGATSRSDKSRDSVSSGLLSPDKGVIKPEATITVNSVSDVANNADGLCTLREAITAANNNAASGATAGECAAGSSGGADTINIAVTGAIDLTSALPDITTSLNITGPGSSQVTVQRNAGGFYRIFTVTSGTVAISGLTVTSGHPPDSVAAPGRNGGGILNSATLTLSDVAVTANTAGTGGNGGGIANTGTMTMTNCTVSGNHSGDGSGGGGGIYNTQTLTITGGEISANSAGSNGGSPGGGISSASGTLTLTGVRISSNTAADNTGGGSGGNGGGISVSGVLTLTNVVVDGNRGGSVIGPFSSVIGGAGGGIFCACTATISNSTVSGNNSGAGKDEALGGDGGGILAGGSVLISNSTFSGNTGTRGGGIGAFGAVRLVNSTLSGNTSFWGGGLYFPSDPGGTLNLTNCTVTGNASKIGGNGIGINSSNGTAAIRNTVIARNGRDPDNDRDLNGAFVSQGHNLIGVASGSSGFANGSNGDQAGTDASRINPQLGPLANNGGATMTHALLSNSTALDAGDDCVTQASHCSDPNLPQLLTDQRGAGFNRPVDGPDVDTTATVDIGAYEMQAPLANLADTNTNEDTQVVVPFDGGDTSTITSVTATSSTSTLVPNDSAHLSVAITGSTGIVTINPATNANGTANITVTVNRTGPSSASKSFMLTVNPVNDAPSFTKGPDQTINEDAGAQTVTNWATSISAGPVDEAAQTLTFQVANNTNAALFSAAPAISSTGTLTYTPASDANGTATITIALKDNGGTASGGVDTSATQTFSITVNPVNDAPSFTKGPDVTGLEDSGSRFVSPWATGISAGAPDESGQTLTFQVTNNTNAALFSSAPTVSSSGSLSYTPATNANGSATITIVLKDNGGTANGGVDTSAAQTFTITVTPVNDAPSFTKGPNQTVNNNAGAQTVANWATSISPGPADEAGQTVSFQVTANSNPSLFTVGPAISPSGTLTYQPAATAAGSANITINLQDNGGTANGGQNTSASQSFTITVTAVGGLISFNATNFNTTESSGFTTITVRRTGDTSRAVTVDYATSGDTGLPCATTTGAASPKCDFTSAIGTLKFAAGDSTKPITILITQDSFVEGFETFSVTLSNPTGNAALTTPVTATVTIADDPNEPSTNPIDDASNFVRQHYHDFLNREPDAGGLAFWTNEITSCGSNQACIDLKRINVSAAFFLSIEFQDTGYLVERLYKTSYGDATGMSTFGGAHQLPVPIIRFSEFLPDTQQIGQGVVVGQGNWQQQLESNRQAFAADFVLRSRFATALPTTMTPAQFVNQLNTNAGNVLSASERATAIGLFGSATDTSNMTARAQALRQVAEDPDLNSAEFNRAFVLMQYFGYLRRNPNDPQDTDHSGYDFWLSKLNQFNGNFVNADMVKAFITASEYRQRFGP